MKNVHNYFKAFNYILSLLIGLTYCIYMIYIRFIIERFPKELTFWAITTEGTIIHYGVLIIMGIHLIIYIFILHTCLINFLGKAIKINFINKIAYKIYYIIKKSFINFIDLVLARRYNLIMTPIINGAYFYIYTIMRVESTPTFNFSGKEIKIETYIIYYWIQKLIFLLLAVCFLIDVFFYFKLFYFYKALSLLGIILIMDLLNFIFARYLQIEVKGLLREFHVYFLFQENDPSYTFIRTEVTMNQNTYAITFKLLDESYTEKPIKGFALTTIPGRDYTYMGFKTIAALEKQATDNYVAYSDIMIFRGYCNTYAEQMDKYVWTILSLIYISGWLYVIGINIL